MLVVLKTVIALVVGVDMVIVVVVVNVSRKFSWVDSEIDICVYGCNNNVKVRCVSSGEDSSGGGNGHVVVLVAVVEMMVEVI